MENRQKMGFNATWAMAVGGMVGGGIFSVLGFIVKLAGNFAWISFIIAGLIALATGISYSNLTNKYKKGGGSFTFIQKIHHEGLAGALSWLLIMGYVLTISVYAFTFGHYLGYVLNIEGTIYVKFFSVAIILIFIAINLRGVGKASWVEIFTVWGKILILLLITGFGFQYFHFPEFTQGLTSNNYINILAGSASIFMAYEGFELIAYDYSDIKNPTKTIHRAEILAILSVILIYVLVTIGTTLLVGNDVIIQKQEVAIAVAGQKAMGFFGLILATIGAMFSTSSAINSTLFSSARFADTIARGHELPPAIEHENIHHVPNRAIIIIGGVGAVVSVLGSLNQLVEGASFIFLITFMTVNLLALFEIKKHRYIALFGTIGSLVSIIILLMKFITEERIVLIFLLVLILFVTVGRRLILKHK